jgi:hypothetical protein
MCVEKAVKKFLRSMGRAFPDSFYLPNLDDSLFLAMFNLLIPPKIIIQLFSFVKTLAVCFSSPKPILTAKDFVNNDVSLRNERYPRT